MRCLGAVLPLFTHLSLHTYRRSVTRTSDIESIPSILRSLKESKLALAALNGIKSNLGKKIRRLQRRAVPLVLEDGIKRLPDEILAHIFKMGHLTTDYSEFSLRVSHVSHRFRQVSLRTPILWARFSTLLPDDQIEAFISRSARLDLHLSTYWSQDSPLSEIELFLSRLGEHSNRWSTLVLYNHDVLSTMQALGFTDLSRLQAIEHHLFDASWSSWNLPSLSGLIWHYCFDISFPLFPQLTSLSVEFFHTVDVSMADFTKALLSMKSLREFSVSLERVNSIRPDPTLDNAKVVCPTPRSVHIEKLNIRMMHQTRCSVIRPIFCALSCLSPSVTHMTLENLLYDYPQIRMLDDKLPLAPIVHICIFRGGEKNIGTLGEYPLLPVLLQHDIVHSIHIEAPTAPIIAPWDPLSPSGSLRNLSLKNCDQLTEDDLQKLAELINLTDEVEGLQTLDVISCRGISKDFLLNLEEVVGKKLRWTR